MTERNEIETGTSDAERAPRRRSRHGFWFGVVAGGLLGLVAGGVAAVGATAWAAPELGHRFGSALQDPDLAREHAEFATAWLFEHVDATDDQKARAKAIVDEAVADVLPIVASHRQGHEAFVEELTRTEIDPAAIEQIRLSQLDLLDQASRSLVGTLTDLASVLTPEQRAELVEMARSHHR